MLKKLAYSTIAFAVVITGINVNPLFSNTAEASNCRSAHRVLYNVQSEMLQVRRDLRAIRDEFEQSYAIQQRWQKKAKR